MAPYKKSSHVKPAELAPSNTLKSVEQCGGLILQRTQIKCNGLSYFLA